MSKIVALLSLILTCAIGVWKMLSRKNQIKREQAEKAKTDLENANKNDSPSDFLDGFGRMQ